MKFFSAKKYRETVKKRLFECLLFDKGGVKMNIRKIVGMAGMAVVFTLLVAVAPALAGGDPPVADLTQGTIQGPEMWGVIVIDCVTASGAFAMLRVKRIVDCNVQATAEAGVSFNCPNDASGIPQNAMLSDITLFSDDPAGSTPVITKVKNFVKETEGTHTLVSFDAQIKYFVPNPQ